MPCWPTGKNVLLSPASSPPNAAVGAHSRPNQAALSCCCTGSPAQDSRQLPTFPIDPTLAPRFPASSFVRHLRGGAISPSRQSCKRRYLTNLNESTHRKLAQERPLSGPSSAAACGVGQCPKATFAIVARVFRTRGLHTSAVRWPPLRKSKRATG